MNLTINGEPFAVEPKPTLLDTLLELGIEVPNLCHLTQLEPYGGCGLCLVEVEGFAKPMRACVLKPTEGMCVTTFSDRLYKARQATLALLLSDHAGDCKAPCALACPTHQDCQGYIGLLANGKTDEALMRILDDNPLPACIGRVCPHPCEEACRRELLEAPLSIMQLKRFAADMGDSEYLPEVEPATGKRVAIVGAGPAGLSAAWFLARAGHCVEVFEQMPAPGGMLRYGIPAYRLEKDIIDKEVARIEKLGVRFHYNRKLGVGGSVESLQQHFDAVFVAVGAWQSSGLGCEGDDLPNVLGGIDFLRRVATGERPNIGDRVAVVGGGNTAMDAVRTAVRLGAKHVTLLYRRTQDEMPADQQEIEEAMEEGVEFAFLVAPKTVAVGQGCLVMTVSKMKLGEPDASGRRRPEDTGDTEALSFDTIIAAIGQKVLPDGIETLEKHRWQTIKVDAHTFQTNLPGVFAGGDAVNDGPGIAITAIAHGKQAALAIDAFLYGVERPMQHPFLVKKEHVTKADLPIVPVVLRVAPTHQTPEERKVHFHEFVHTFSTDDARREASRCLECGCCDLNDCRLLPLLQAYDAKKVQIHGRKHTSKADNSHPMIWRDPAKCVLCGLCVRVCRSLVGECALALDGRGFDTQAEPALGMPLFGSDCSGCSMCTDICPTGALQARVPFAKQPPLPDATEIITCTLCAAACAMEIARYGSQITRVTPVDPTQTCTLGRYAPLLPIAITDEQRAILSQVLMGDTRHFQGDVTAACNRAMENR